MKQSLNWAGNYKYSASALHTPVNVEQVQEIVASSKKVKVLGTRHSFNHIADTTEDHISLQHLNQVIALDPVRHQVTVQAGIRYGELCEYLYQHGYALHNLASLPHISVSGACATATHGSGDRNGNLATIVDGMEIVLWNGEKAVFSADKQNLAGAVVGLGGLGVVTQMTLNIIPSFEVSQYVYDDLPFAQLERHLDDIFSSAYSVSLFTDWKSENVNQVWVKSKLPDGVSAGTAPAPEFYGARLAASPRHPVPGYSGENCSEQMGVPGPWHERLPHFRMAFTPSAGEELQSEYFVPRQAAYQALQALHAIREHIAPLLYVSEIRTIAKDELWMSPNYLQDSVAVHFTWRPQWEAVRSVLPLIEKQLEPYGARPHWGKLFTMEPSRLKAGYEKLPDFQQLLRQCDPHGKFRNAFLDTYIGD
ncbi:FAD-binding protein [Paenibacillus sp. GCM10023248]|uniref:FAD-binding protein n=1 Tax=unclassified Paenibacillus TaxID=185978 RepID=UPI002378AAF6|nr:FAD-binding protein [Paenibacillus sp. MAHUQ-63]MDD9268234.1 FAD-binding protein [Paenibacillus sp. MAHUQ-63]